jgi:hypothetical protein
MIRDSEKRKIQVVDTVKWSIAQACIHMENSAALWAQQGSNYLSRISAAEQYNRVGAEAELANALREPEAKTLAQLYLPSQR